MTEMKINRDRLLRCIRGLQLLQRANAPNSRLAKAATKALAPLLTEAASMPADAAPLTAEDSSSPNP